MAAASPDDEEEALDVVAEVATLRMMTMARGIQIMTDTQATGAEDDQAKDYARMKEKIWKNGQQKWNSILTEIGLQAR